MRYQPLMLLVCLTAYYAGFAQVKPRIYSNEFLNIGAGARGLGMGSNSVASANDATAGYWNPAGLVGVKDFPSVTAMHAEYFSGIGKYDYVAAAFPMKGEKQRTLGISAIRFGIDDIPNTIDLVQPDGSVNYDNITTFSSADYAFLLSYAQVLKEGDGKRLSIGGNAKIIYRKVGTFANAVGFGFDAGVQYRTGKWMLGASLRDVTSTFNAWKFSFTDREKEVFYLTDNDIPVKSTELTLPRLILGGAYNFNFSTNFQLLAEVNMDMTFDGKRNTIISSKTLSVDPKVGLEANIHKVVFVRLGASNFQQVLKDGDTLNQQKVWILQPSIGAGFKVGNVAIDYAFTNLANQSNPLYTHVFSLRLDLVRKKEELQ